MQMRCLFIDRQIRIYDTSYGRFKKFNSLHALDVGWSVLDTAFRYSMNGLMTLDKVSY